MNNKKRESKDNVIPAKAGNHKIVTILK